MSYRLRTDLSARVVDGELVVLDRKGGRVHRLNPTASYIWASLEDGSPPGTIAEAFASEFGIDMETAIGDITRVIAQLRDLELLEDAS